MEYENQDVKIGDKSKCEHCGEEFTLVDAPEHPEWRPDDYE